MKTIAPNNKRIIVALLVPLVVLVVFLVARATRDNVAGNSDTFVVLGKEYDFDKDSDKDGLLDWEEALWGTDVNNSDSDGDGFKDGEEVRSNRSPLIPRPGDIVTDTQKASVYTADPNFITLNRTQQIADIFGPNVLLIMHEQALGNEISKEALENIADSTLDSVVPRTPTLYTDDDIIIAKDTSNQATIDYLSHILKETIDVGLVAPYEEDLLVMSRALDRNDPLILNELNKNITAYKTIQEIFLLTSVPADLAPEHLSIINNYQKIIQALEDMGNIFEDPFTGLTAMGLYRSALSQNDESFTRLGETLFEALSVNE